MTLDWNDYLRCARETAAEGAVLLENDGTLPLSRDREFALFGRMQLHYYKSGTGSGGLVNAPKVTGILDGILEAGFKVNEEVLAAYRSWDEANPVKIADGWGGEPWSQEEMPLDDALVKRAAETSSAAVCIIARTAGEEQENKPEKGSYYLSDGEEEMLRTVTAHFDKVAVLLNTGNIIDMSFVKKYGIGAVMYVWHGGMTGGSAVADVLCDVSPSGHLPDTIPVSLDAVPSNSNFGDTARAVYAEDIYVGYRYYETLAPEKVLYPFGYGKSYTEFDVKADIVGAGAEGIKVRAQVTNTGTRAGKRAVMVYVSAPQGRLGKPARVLAGFDKTGTLAAGASQTIEIDISPRDFCSYDDSGITGHKSAFVLEKGEYIVYTGTDVRSAAETGRFVIAEDTVTEQLSQALAPVESFDRLRSDGTYEAVPVLEVSEEERRKAALPASMPITGDKGFKLADVGTRCTMEQFVAQFSEKELCSIARGEGMNSPRVTMGTAAAFGGVTDALAAYGIPAGCCADGPSGIRLDCGTPAFSMPIGTLIASTFNKAAAAELFTFAGTELRANNVDCLLGPGMNIHRHPLGGRNFEYFSEDPLLTGQMASAELCGLRRGGANGVMKHFCGNNQETGRHTVDSVISERALREIYLRGFEIGVKNGAESIMTTYGKVNGLYTSCSYDLDTVILREQWGFDGFLMTDWWANTARRGQEPQFDKDIAQVARSQNDVYMVTGDPENHEDTLTEALAQGYITVGELQRNAMNICRFLKGTYAFERLAGTAEKVTIEGREAADDAETGDVPIYTFDGELVLTDEITAAGGSAVHMLLDSPSYKGFVTVTVTARAEGSSLAQLPLTLSSMGTPFTSFTYRGGETASYSGRFPVFSRYTTFKMFFRQSGLYVTELRFKAEQ